MVQQEDEPGLGLPNDPDETNYPGNEQDQLPNRDWRPPARRRHSGKNAPQNHRRISRLGFGTGTGNGIAHGKLVGRFESAPELRGARAPTASSELQRRLESAGESRHDTQNDEHDDPSLPQVRHRLSAGRNRRPIRGLRTVQRRSARVPELHPIRPQQRPPVPRPPGRARVRQGRRQLLRMVRVLPPRVQGSGEGCPGAEGAGRHQAAVGRLIGKKRVRLIPGRIQQGESPEDQLNPVA